MSDLNVQDKIPVLLLKTKSIPADGYEDYFNSAKNNNTFQPIFVPVLEHQFRDDALQEVRSHIESSSFVIAKNRSYQGTNYGGIIFTSQRAVEAFTKVVDDLRETAKEDLDVLLSENLPLYVVGPATERGLQALNLKCPILGQETGNGDALAQFILGDFTTRYAGEIKPSLLFLVGETRRDIIPNSLSLHNIHVDELVVYESGEMQSFRSNFTSIWKTHAGKSTSPQWIVVFSPMGCKAMLESLGLLDKDVGKANPLAVAMASREQKVFIATIGPTTRDYLREEFSIEPDVCAEKPSPEGVGATIQAFMLRL